MQARKSYTELEHYYQNAELDKGLAFTLELYKRIERDAEYGKG